MRILEVDSAKKSRVPDCVLDALLRSVKSRGYENSSSPLEVLHKEEDPKVGRLEHFAIRTKDDEMMLMWQLYRNVLTLDIASIDAPHQRAGLLTAVMAELKRYKDTLQVNRFGVAGVISTSMHNWCIKQNMRRLDGAERWSIVPKSPVDYLIEWNEGA